jgi:6-phosphofructokinase 1
MAGISTGADFIFLPERPPEVGKWEKEMLAVIEKVSPSCGKLNY